MKYNVSIIGPIGDIGGRELETGFIGKTLQDNDCNVQVISTINYTSNSQLFDFVDTKTATQLNEIILKNNLWFKFLAYLGYLKGGKRKPVYYYVSNAFSKKTGFKPFAVKTLTKIVNQSDVVLLCAQISSTYVKEIVEYAHQKNKPVVIRTSAMISDTDYLHKEWLEKVTLFIHHSESNASRLSFLEKHNYKIIDQCTFKESKFLNIEPVSKCSELLYIGRLSPEKGILEFLEMYNTLGNNMRLKIIGDGELTNKVQSLIKDKKHISLLGYLSQNEIIEHMASSDAVLITSHEESGPLVGLEAMAAARLVISTKVGAMPQRLKGLANQFWFNLNNSSSLVSVLSKLKSLNSEEIKTIATENRAHYLANYRKNTLENLYKNTIFNLIKNKTE